MGVITTMRRGKAIWWSKTGRGVSGDPTFAAPVEISCRWEDVQERFIDLVGAEVVSSALVYVDRDMKAGDFLQRGELESGTPANPTDSSEAWEMRDWNKLPNFKETEYLRSTHL